MKRNYRRLRAAYCCLLASQVLISRGALAQSSLTMYGILDAGVQYLTNADGRHASVRLQNYGVLPSQIGITGAEALGGGLQAFFKLEQGLNLNDGTPTVPGIAFFRGAYVGLTGDFGTVTIGRQFSVLFDKTVLYDPLQYAAYGGQGVLMPLMSNFIDNAFKYKTREFGGFNAEALAATGGVAGNSRSGRVLEIGGEYASRGLGVSAVLHRRQGTLAAATDTSGQQLTAGTLAGHWSIDPLTLYGGVERLTGSLAPSRTVGWTGVRYQAAADLGFAGGVYQTFSNTASIGRPTLFIASSTYNLSKRSVVYANLGFARNHGHSSQTVYEYDPAALDGASQLGAMVGMYHLF
ncbi:porin [Caballeronia sp. KNU42]